MVDFSFVQSDFVPVLYVRHNAENTSLIKQPSTYFKLEIILYLEEICLTIKLWAWDFFCVIVDKGSALINYMYHKKRNWEQIIY